MAITLKAYLDAGLTTEATTADMAAAASASADLQLWLGSTASGMKFQATDDPGVEAIMIDIVDTASGGTLPDTAAKLATTQAGLASATAGASLSAGTTINSGVGNAFVFWLRMTDTLAAAAAQNNLKLTIAGATGSITESPV